ncbi:FGGY family carbohydrate kinase [Streptomyces kunmingensis]|uniref:FGGY family carbohydrate kinase n=1 Tax=Streptomyces kunmingensis TaxID=68225 RepID=A0ABU6CL18_9ACTN|nr:FGGY family carbohydrate kinase [Streptomyces kunmingensis]MEB3965134.1 FGGY family carbohydrate kinase [Streptomyces kunmingensis]
MGIVAGLDSSPDFTRIVVCDSDTGAVLRQGYAPHPLDPVEGGGRPSDVDPQAWLLSLGEAAGGGLLEGVQAIGVSAQQNALVPLDSQGNTVRPAMVGSDKRAQASAADLIDRLGSREAWADAVGSVPQAAQPVTKLRWLARTEPENAQRVALLLQAHDWLVWQLLGRPARRTTDRGGASGTGYWSAATGSWRPDLVELALDRQAMLPEVLGPGDAAGTTPEGLIISAGTGETMAAAFGLGMQAGDAVVSLGASGSVMAVHHEALVDSSGAITSLADATGLHLPVVHTSNAVRALRGTAEMLGLDGGLEGLSELAMKSTPGAHGLVLLPYLEGEKTPNLPHTAGTLSGLRRESMKPEHLARAAFEGMVCGLADAMDVLRGRGVEIRRVFLLGAAAELHAVQAVAPMLFGAQVVVPQPADYAAIGAARQAAWALSGQLPQWQGAAAQVFEPGEEAAVGQAVRQQYRSVREQIHPGAFS